jgi:hypothetical protein
MCSFKFFNQNVCTVNVHGMYYKFNPGPSPHAPTSKAFIGNKKFYWHIESAYVVPRVHANMLHLFCILIYMAISHVGYLWPPIRKLSSLVACA